MRDNAELRNFILQSVGLKYPIHTMLPMTRGLWLMGNVNESGSIMDVSGQGRTLSASGSSSIAIDGTASTATKTTDATTISVNHTVTANSDMGIVVFVGYVDADGRTITCTYDGVSLTGTTLRTKLFAGGRAVVRAFYLAAPTTGSSEAALATFSAAVVSSWIAVVSYSGVNQADMFGAEAGNTGVSSTPSVSVTTGVNNSIILAGYTFYGGDGDPSTPDDTERWDIATGASTADDSTSAGGELLQASAGAGTVSMTANANDDWAISGIEIKAASTSEGNFSVDNYMPYAILDGSINWSRSDEAGLDITNVLTMGGYHNFDNTASVDEFIMGKWTETGNERSYGLKRDSNGNIVAMISSNGTAETTQTSTDTVAADTPVFVALRYDPSNELSVFVGQEGATTGVLVEDLNTTSIPAALNSGAADFSIGARDTSGTAADFMTGWAGSPQFLCNAILSDNYLNQIYSQTRLLLDV